MVERKTVRSDMSKLSAAKAEAKVGRDQHMMKRLFSITASERL